METPPIHVLLALDAQILGGEMGHATSTPSSPVVSLTGNDDDDEDWSPESPALGRDGPATVADEGEGTTRTTSSRFWGVSWSMEPGASSVGSTIQRCERQAQPHRPLRHRGGRRARSQRRDSGSSSRRPTSAPHEPGRRRAAGAQAPPPRLRIHSHHLTPAPRPRTPAPSRTGSHPQSRRAG